MLYWLLGVATAAYILCRIQGSFGCTIDRLLQWNSKTSISRSELQAGSFLVVLLFSFPAMFKDVDAKTQASTSAVFLGTVVIAATCIVGAWRYSDPPTCKNLHFFMRQHAQTIPMAMFATAAIISFDNETNDFLQANVNCIAMAVSGIAFLAYYLNDEKFTLIAQVPAILIMFKETIFEIRENGWERPQSALLAALVLFAIRESPLKRIVPQPKADVLRRMFLLLAVYAVLYAFGNPRTVDIMFGTIWLGALFVHSSIA
eukprot:gb/GECG01013966.1/.p1 GENE.gb/GECG01013966.1/~~gb/GECG01013966.1/.p1  ORF type:complete len:259 (+),score=26.41 gb/GECG01013966.1/:1-777(+)